MKLNILLATAGFLGFASMGFASSYGSEPTDDSSFMYEDTVTQSSIVEIAGSSKDFSTLVTALTEADLLATLEGEGPFTVFAPTNDAFAKIDGEELQKLLKNKEALRNVLLYHVVSGAAVPAQTAVTLPSAEMANGQSVELSTLDGSLMINGTSTVIKTDIVGSNGIIHVIDTVLLP